MTFGEKLLRLRQKAGMSQDALAEKLDVSRQAVSKWERDEAAPETDKIIKLAQLFQVSTDYLLMDAPVAAQPAPPRYTANRPTASERIERFIRLHGYKSGYFLIGAGVFLCILALLVLILLPKFGSGLFDAAKDTGNNWDNGIYIEGDLPQDVLDSIYGQAGSGMGYGGLWGDMKDDYQHSVQQMQSAWQGTLGIMAALFAVPVLLLGGALIVVGCIIVSKGKKIASQTV